MEHRRLGEVVFLNLKQDMYHLNLGHLEMPESRETTKNYWGYAQTLRNHLEEAPTGRKCKNLNISGNYICYGLKCLNPEVHKNSRRKKTLNSSPFKHAMESMHYFKTDKGE